MAISRRPLPSSMTWPLAREHGQCADDHGGTRDTAELVACTLPQWEELIHQARRANLLSRIALDLAELDCYPACHSPPARTWRQRW
jgi:hypothetical protein